MERTKKEAQKLLWEMLCNCEIACKDTFQHLWEKWGYGLITGANDVDDILWFEKDYIRHALMMTDDGAGACFSNCDTCSGCR